MHAWGSQGIFLGVGWVLVPIAQLTVNLECKYDINSEVILQNWSISLSFSFFFPNDFLSFPSHTEELFKKQICWCFFLLSIFPWLLLVLDKSKFSDNGIVVRRLPISPDFSSAICSPQLHLSSTEKCLQILKHNRFSSISGPLHIVFHLNQIP